MSPHLVADVVLYATGDGGARLTKHLGWGCLCSPSKSNDGTLFHDAWLLLDLPLAPGERRRIGFIFLAGEESTSVLRDAGKFYLWEGHLIGEATFVS
jgi:hypothetical protein